MSAPPPVVPPHLRAHVVEQDYGAYGEIAQAVWRFVMLNNHSRLKHSAHPAYTRGLEAAGMNLERIPRIAEMNDCLSRFGWGAVCVDGFIPPRAFVEFQALGLLPIAAEIRTLAHLAYTPAPDILHEAGGHAPFLAEPEYGAYIRAIGEVGKRAFTLPEDALVHRAIHALSEVKENPAASDGDVARAEQALKTALAHCQRTSDAAKLARLYWWTAEYGLIDTPSDYRLYGAGLLSSLWEAHACHDPQVSKRALDAGCIEVSYDITQPQPQLFVARDFAHLSEVLADVEGQLAHHRGGAIALAAATESGELSTITFNNGAALCGRLHGFDSERGATTWLAFTGPCLTLPFGENDTVRSAGNDYQGPVGDLLETSRRALSIAQPGSPVSLSYVHGATATGTLVRCFNTPSGELAAATLADAEIARPGQATHRPEGVHPFVFSDVAGAHAGAQSAELHDAISKRPSLVPRGGTGHERDRALERLYERASALNRAPNGQGVAQQVAELHAALGEHFPNEWLLRWKLLESLLVANQDPERRITLENELQRLEGYHQYRQPIATGLHYLSRELGMP